MGAGHSQANIMTGTYMTNSQHLVWQTVTRDQCLLAQLRHPELPTSHLTYAMMPPPLQDLEATGLAAKRCRTAGESAVLSHNQTLRLVKTRNNAFATSSSKYGSRVPLEQVRHPPSPTTPVPTCALCWRIKFWSNFGQVPRDTVPSRVPLEQVRHPPLPTTPVPICVRCVGASDADFRKYRALKGPAPGRDCPPKCTTYRCQPHCSPVHPPPMPHPCKTPSYAARVPVCPQWCFSVYPPTSCNV
jgi:hypothetical protein